MRKREVLMLLILHIWISKTQGRQRTHSSTEDPENTLRFMCRKHRTFSLTNELN